MEPLASQRHAIITGGTSGIGKSTALELAMKGMSVTIACRDKERGILVADEISQLSRNSSVRPMVCDLSSFASIMNFVKEYKEIGYPLHVLINNSGIMACPQSYTKDGFEMQFGVNHLGHFLLTSLLLDTLKSSAFSGTCSRVVVLASAAEHIGNLDFKDLNFKFSRGYNPWIAYGQSKLANCLFSFELSRRCKVRGLPITSNCMHPGIVATKLIRYVLPQALIEDSIPIMPSMRSILKLIGIRTPEEGARTCVYLATSRDVEDTSGYYFEDCKVRKPSSKATDTDLASKLWNISEELTKTSHVLEPLGLDQMSMEAINMDSNIR